MTTIDILGVSHSYELTPPRPSSLVLVFIHGWLLSRNYWLPLIERLAPKYQCLSYDLRGFGDSTVKNLPISNPSYSLASYAKDLSVLLDRLQLETVWLIGHSLGGSIALWGADCYPEKVKGVICLNSGGGIYLKEGFERFRTVGQQLVESRPPWLTYFPGIDWLFARNMVKRPLSRQWGHQRIVDFIKADREAALGALLESTTETEVHLLPQIVARLKQPVYFIAGGQDRIMELKYVYHLASFHPLFNYRGDNVFEVDDCGHLAMMEQTEKVEHLINSILISDQDVLSKNLD
jgi:2-succinyl-6-hydroxy-2,4-cyclohexadiene-1-carboxylate synthase